MRTIWVLVTSLMASVSTAQTLQDVIYKKDGSVLRGNLIEQDFILGRYKIRLLGGSIFSVDKTEIEKISKEASPSKPKVTHGGLVNVNIENNPSIHQQPVIKQTAQARRPYAVVKPKSERFKHSIRMGTMRKDVTDSDYNGLGYRGYNIAYQYNYDKHIAIYGEFNHGNLTSVIINDMDYDAQEYGQENSSARYRGGQLAAMLSTNNYEGWQFYAGLGAFIEGYTEREDMSSIAGTIGIVGMGYCWTNKQVQARVTSFESSDYPDNLSSDVVSLQLGLNF